jgi:glycosyltransferase involved in cell wall biosynthesis
MKKGHEVTVITLSDNIYHNDSKYPFEVLRIKRSILKPLRILQTIQQIIKVGRKSDLLFVNGLAIEAVLANIVLRKLMVQKIVGDWAWERARNQGVINDNIEEFQKRRYSRKVEFFKKLRTFSAKKADIIITPSEYLRKIVSGWGINGNHIKVIYNATEDSVNPHQESPIKVPEDLGPSGHIVVTAGRLVPWKWIDQLIEVVSQLDDVNLVIVGDGPEEDNLRSLSVKLGLKERIKFTGRLSQPGVLQYLRSADVFVLNSTYEGLPHIVLEAMSVDTPVIATRVGGTPEIIEDGVNGILIQPNNQTQLKEAIEQVLKDEGLRKGLVKNARERLRKFSWENLVNQTLHLFEEAGSTK